SYGIGKFAPFTVSELRTVFVSTVWSEENGTTHHYVQGKSVLMSHIDGAGNTRRGTGFWGIRDRCQPVQTLRAATPDWLRLTDDKGALGQHGPMLSIIGFQPTKGWQNVLVANVIENCFGAILRGELEVTIEGGATVSASTFSDLLADKDIKA